MEEVSRQCPVCSADYDEACVPRTLPCKCGVTMCEGCATETVENGLCCECFDAIDAGGDVEAYVTALAARRRKKRASTIEDRARRFDIPASSARVAAVDLAGVGRRVLSPADLRYKFACGEAVALDEVLRLLAAGRETMAAEPNVLRLAAPLVLVGDLHGQYADLMTVVHGGGAGPRARAAGAPESDALAPGLDDDDDDDGDDAPRSGLRRRRSGLSDAGDDSESSGDEAFYGGGRAGDGALLFLGDYVDRGARGCEVLLYLLALKVAHPGLAHLGPGKALAISRSFPAQVHLLRGNHESRACTGHFGFRAECRRKYGLGAYHEFCRVFEAMPLAAVVDCDLGKVFACHGGIGPDLETIADLEALDRRAEPPDEGLLCDVLWADPSRDDAGGAAVDAWGPNPLRGCSVVFGERATEAFLEINGLTALVRAHEVMEAGLSCDFGDVDVPFSTSGPKELVDAATDAARTKLGRVTTVFSASNYCGKHANLGAALLLGRAKATALLFEPSACAADVEAPGETEGDEAHFVRQAYLVVPYMPTSFRSLVDTAKELLGLKSFLSPVRARRKRGADPALLEAPRGAASPRAARGPKLEENRDPLAVSWADGVSGSPPAKPRRRRRPPPAWRFAAALRGDAINELSPAAMRKRLAPSRGFAPPGIKAFLATIERGAPGVPRKTAIHDSSAKGLKSLVTDSYRSGHTMSPELKELSRGLRADAEIFALRLIFSLFDADNTGAISREELALYAEDVGECISPADVDVVFTVLDADGDKAVGLEEWTLFAAKLKAGWALAALPDSAAKSPAA
ncbi:calcium-dependent protein serine/threonine phosphatase [Aureococcus anophagefferens]|nr:calcium-dependent protein serine/threonine phosphatase [Aureococcus anophagefferens]